jgi:Uma2 family endonuclease
MRRVPLQPREIDDGTIRAQEHLMEPAHFRTKLTLVVEILSPSTKRRDQRLKRDLYERVGVREYRLVDPVANVVIVFRRGKRGFGGPQDYSALERATLATPLLPKLRVPLAKLFA